MKKRIAKIILDILGILLIIAFFASIAYDYYLMNSRIFSNPLGLGFTAVLSGLIFLLPGLICITVSYYLKRTETK